MDEAVELTPEEISEKKIIWPVLMLDDEPDDIGDLELVIDEMGSRMNHDLLEVGARNYPYYLPESNRVRLYASYPLQAVEIMNELIDEGKRISAIISDVSMAGEEGSSITGDDFLRIINGKPTYCVSGDKSDLDIDIYEARSFRDLLEFNGRRIDDDDDEIFDFLETNWEDIGQYTGFVEYFFGEQAPRIPQIILCGNPKKADYTGLEEVIAINKQRTKGSRHACEREVLAVLREFGVFPGQYIDQALNGHHRLSPDLPVHVQTFRKNVRNGIGNSTSKGPKDLRAIYKDRTYEKRGGLDY
ncbi:TPA: hypothetical protein ENS27_16260 [bacterium]|nr:hypothetical protein [bacterium]